jgi:hypothetical protein
MQEEIQTTAAASATQPATFDTAKFWERMKKERDDRRARLLTNRVRIQKSLKRLKATKVLITYCGSGDSGQIEGVSIYQGETELKSDKKISVLEASSRFEKEAGTWVEKVRGKRKPLADAIEDLVYDWLEVEHAGWENNDGASGECTIDVTNGDFLLSHTMYYTESVTTEHSL